MGSDFYAVLEQVLALLRSRGRVTYNALQLQFHLDDDLLEILKEEIVTVHQLGRDQEGTKLVWTGDTAPATVPVSPPTPDPVQAPLTYTPPYLAEKIFTSRAALEGERKQVTVLFADLKGSTALIEGLDPEEARRLLDPALLALLDAVPEDSPFLRLDPPQRRQRTLDALKRVLLRESQEQPLLLVFEDLHWIDAETQALLNSLVESLPPARLLLLVNYRPEYQHGWGSKTSYTQLRLDPLPPVRAEEFLQAMLGDDPGLKPLTDLLIARTEGHPFFLEESVRTLAETGVLVGARAAYGPGQALAGLQVPATVQAVLAARIDRLPAEEKRLLQTAAVLGTEVPLPLLHAIAEWPEAGLQRHLTALQSAEFLYETRLFPEHEYTFKHALTHEVAYSSLLLERRRVLHARIVEALEAGPPRLFLQGSDGLGGGVYLGRARCRRRGAPHAGDGTDNGNGHG